MAATVANANAGATRGWPLSLPERLPDLKGKWLTLYSVLWAVALLVAVVAPIRSTMLNYDGLRHPIWRPHGLVTTTTDTSIIVRTVFGDEARRAGVRAGDQIIAVDGWRLGEQSADVHFYKLLAGPEGSTDTLRLRSPSGQEREVTLTSRASTAAQFFRGTVVGRATFDAATLFLNLALLLFLVPAALILFVRRRREMIPALLSLSFLITTAFLSGSTALINVGVSDRVGDTILDLFAWMPLVLALVTFPDGRLVSKWTAVAPLLFAIGAINDFSGGVDWFEKLTAGLAFIIAGIALAVRYRRFPAGLGRQQLRWAFFGFFVGISLILIVVPLLIAQYQLTAADPRWAVWSSILLDVLVGLSFPCMALGLIISVLKYRLYDADTVIGRSVAYGVMTFGFVALFAGAEKLAELIGERYFEHSIGIVAGAVGAAVAAAVVVPLHNRVHGWAERRFQKALIRLRHGLPEYVGDLRESAAVDDLIAAVMKRVEVGIHSTREAVLLRKNGKWSVAAAHRVPPTKVREWRRGWKPPMRDRTLDCERADPLFPMRVRLCIETGDEPETIGWILLGPRPDGSFFGRDEREALAHIAGPVARAIHIAQLRERRQEQA